MSRRVRISSKEYDELVGAQRWCAKNDFRGFAQFYDELLTFLGKRRSLPPEAYSEDPLDAVGR